MEMSRREFVAGLSASCFLCGCVGSEKRQAQEKENEPAKEQPAPKPEGEN